MTTYIIQIIAAIIGSIGFALTFNLKKAKIPFIIVGSGLGWAIYLLCYHYTQNLFLSNVAASIFCSGSAEILARWRKAPATLFLLIHISFLQFLHHTYIFLYSLLEVTLNNFFLQYGHVS